MLQTFVQTTAEGRASLMKRVTSRQNPLVARFRAAARGDSESVVLLVGAHLVADALDAGIRLRDVAVSAGADSRPDIAALLRRVTHARVEVIEASPAVIAALSPVKSTSTIVAVADRPTIDGGQMYSGQSPLVLIA